MVARAFHAADVAGVASLFGLLVVRPWSHILASTEAEEPEEPEEHHVLTTHSLSSLGIENLRCRNAFPALGSHLVTTGIDGEPLRVRWLPARAMTAVAAVEPHHARLIRRQFHSNTYVVRSACCSVVCVGASGVGAFVAGRRRS